jgi:alpha-L-arabinofuranosidase
MKLYGTWGAVLAMAWAATPGLARSETASVTVVVDTSAPGPEIDRHIYGQFIEHGGSVIYDGVWVGEHSAIPNAHGYRKDVVDALQSIHVPVVRWPGGCFADQYDWRDGIGPRGKRPVRANKMWGGLDSNAFGTHEFLNFAELIGADAYISGNVGSMTPRDMSQWLEYMTSSEKTALAEERRRNGRAKPWRVRYFGIGNEIWGCGGMMRPEYAGDVTVRYSYYLEGFHDPEHPDPDRTLIKVASGPTGNIAGYEAFTEGMMGRAKKFIEDLNFGALSLHYYATPLAADQEVATDDLNAPPGAPKAPTGTAATGFGEDTWANLLRSARGIDHVIGVVSAIMDKYDPDKKVALFVDEWGAYHEPEGGGIQSFGSAQNTLLDAEIAALSLNAFQRHADRVKMANITMMINAGQALILTKERNMLLTPTYHIFDMYQPFRGAVTYGASASGAFYCVDGHCMPAVDVSAAKGKDGKLYLALINVDPNRAADITTNLTGRSHGRVLTGPAMDTHNTFEAPLTVHPMPFAGDNLNGKVIFHLPPKAVAVVAIE